VFGAGSGGEEEEEEEEEVRRPIFGGFGWVVVV
jgi:hypothetical protein